MLVVGALYYNLRALGDVSGFLRHLRTSISKYGEEDFACVCTMYVSTVAKSCLFTVGVGCTTTEN